jgi:hypothetical protein
MHPSTTSRKRERGAGVGECASLSGRIEADSVVSVAAQRKKILDQIDNLEPLWAATATRYRVAPYLEAVLKAIGNDIAASLKVIPEKAESERQRLQALRACAHTAIDVRFDELVSALDSVAGVKISLLEQELVRIDDAVEQTRRDFKDARDAATTLDDADFSEIFADLSARLVAVDAILPKIPVCPVEPALLRLDFDVDAFLNSIRTAGVVIAPQGVSARDVMMCGLPKYFLPGHSMQFELALTDDYPSRAPAEREVASVSLVSHALVDVSLMLGANVFPLAATLAPLSGGRGVSVRVHIPAGTDRNRKVVINGMTVARQPAVNGLSLPMAFSILSGMHAPLILKGAVSQFGITPVITSDGTLYVPSLKSPSVQKFSADGTPLPPLSVTGVRLSEQTRAAAYVNSSNTLLLADFNGNASKLVAVDMTSRVVRWTTAPGMFDASLFGIAVLSQQGVVVVSSYQDNMLHAHHLSDGMRITSVEVTWCTYLASDPAAGTIYISAGTRERLSVVAHRWDGATLVADGIVADAGVAPTSRPLAVMPPAPGQHTSYLIVGTVASPTLHVISLPGRRLFHTHTLEGMQVTGLAADPSGTALAVCDFVSEAVHVLPWPLPGMPALT